MELTILYSIICILFSAGYVLAEKIKEDDKLSFIDYLLIILIIISSPILLPFIIGIIAHSYNSKEE